MASSFTNPKSATFRTADLSGLDIIYHVSNDLGKATPDDEDFTLTPAFRTLVEEKKWLGDKTKGGFYKKVQGAQEEERQALDWKTLEYRPRQKVRFPALDMAKQIDDTSERLRTLLEDAVIFYR